MRPDNSQPAEQSITAAIWAIAWPATLANSAAPLIGLVDTWTLARFGSTADIAAIGAGATIFGFIFWGFGFLRMGTTGMVAQAHGQQNESLIHQLTLQALGLGGVIGLSIVLISPLLLSLGQYLLALPESVIPGFEAYFLIRVLASPITLATFGITGVLLGQQRAKAVMALQLVLNLANCSFNLLFVIQFDMGAGGIALGTVLAETITLFVGIGLLLNKAGLSAYSKRVTDRATWSLSSLKRLISVNFLIFVRTIILLSVFFTMTRASAAFGEEAIAASHVFNTFLLLIALGLDGIAYAAEGLSGAAFGKESRTEFIRVTQHCTLWSLGAALIYCALFWWGGRALITLIIPENGGAIATLLLDAHWILILLPIIGVWSYLFDGLYIGATDSAGLAGTMALSGAVYFLIIGPFSTLYGVEGIWIAILIFLGVRGLAQALWFPRTIRGLGAGEGNRTLV